MTNEKLEKLLRMNSDFVKVLYVTVIEENRDEDVNMFESLSVTQKEGLLSLIEQTRIDTVSHVLGIIDGSSTLNGCSLEPKLLLNTIDTESMLQDSFLEYVEGIKGNQRR